MHAQNSMAVIGEFSNLSDAETAVQNLRRENIGTKVRLIENDSSEDVLHTNSASAMRPERNESPSTGGISGFFARLFGFEDERKDLSLNSDSELYFRDGYQKKHHFVVVDGCADVQRCSQLLMSSGGTIEQRGSELYEQERHVARDVDRASDEVSVMKLREEQLRVDKNRVQTGEVRLRKEIVQETRTIEVPLVREELVIETRPISGTSRPGSLDARDIGKMEEIRIPVSEEQVHIKKEVVPREEVRISKERITENRTVSKDVKHEEAILEEEGRVSVKGNKDRVQPKSKNKSQYAQDDHQAGL